MNGPVAVAPPIFCKAQLSCAGGTAMSTRSGAAVMAPLTVTLADWELLPLDVVCRFSTSEKAPAAVPPRLTVSTLDDAPDASPEKEPAPELTNPWPVA